MWLVDKMVGRMVDKAQMKLTNKQAWLVVAAIAMALSIFTKDDEEPEELSTEAELAAVPDAELQAELDRRTKAKP